MQMPIFKQEKVMLIYELTSVVISKSPNEDLYLEVQDLGAQYDSNF